ncbi:MAG: gluconokinase [Opitutaceae bacterium]|nr:gluconokinase [Opitutaceae bacterium]
MGVAGSGKSTVGRTLADSLGWRFTDADDLHPPANIAKMSTGAALTDADRSPWLAAVRTHIDTAITSGENIVLACSALKASYRAQLIADPARVKLIYLQGTRDQLASRLAARSGHFAPPALLDSQLATLEEPHGAFTLNIAASPEALTADIRRHFGV